jgi:thiazole synthase
MSDKPSKLKIADREFSSRLLVGTGKFSSNETMRDALIASGTEIVTVALRRADLSGKHDPFANILDFIDPKKFLLLPNTSGARDADDAVRIARLAASAGLPTWVKLEIHPDPHYLLPDPVETLAAAEGLVKEGFTVLPYINADPVLGKAIAGRWHCDGDAARFTNSGVIGGLKPGHRSKSSSNKQPSQWWLMLDWARRARRRKRWRWARTPFW